MSKQVEVLFTCPACGKAFETTLYRSLWIEQPENRNLVFDDLVNVVECKKCGAATDVPFSLLVTNKEMNFAVWYEPDPDPQIDEDAQGYEAVFGPGNFYSAAPRIAGWEEFKETILRYENGELVGKPPDQPSFVGFERMLQPSKTNERRPGIIAGIFRSLRRKRES